MVARSLNKKLKNIRKAYTQQKNVERAFVNKDIRKSTKTRRKATITAAGPLPKRRRKTYAERLKNIKRKLRGR